ncbi:venom allergen 5-like [Drosophila ficusphila]|uniref:venom allergen 5-like n=1 Tax=Drosophila ficusphila TaxID=30025 RepID=UPI0007E7D0B5|nr:venom allergen 5-like [Drosophila ficusphila]
MALILALRVVLLLPLISGYNYCNNRSHVCNVGKKKHFMCQLEQELRPYDNKSKLHAVFPDTPKLRVKTLGILNNFRNTFAGGDLITKENKSFPSAKRMRRIIWDKELAYMARNHAATVSFKHTECRSTLRFPVVGEFLALLPPAKKKRNVMDLLTKSFESMLEEYKDVKDPEGLLQCYDSERDSNVGHFTLIANDRVSRVGCGIAASSNCHLDNKVGYCHFLTCHFDYSNLEGSYVYKAGRPAAGCDDWNGVGSYKYANLCQNLGVIFPPNQGD